LGPPSPRDDARMRGFRSLLTLDRWRRSDHLQARPLAGHWSDRPGARTP